MGEFNFDCELGLVLTTRLERLVSPTSSRDLVSAFSIKPSPRTRTLSHRKMVRLGFIKFRNKTFSEKNVSNEIEIKTFGPKSGC